ncbi:hypothetical protein MBGDF03_00843, partial [Thermoplasmatales archaeon SCGC AB-540-F20]
MKKILEDIDINNTDIGSQEIEHEELKKELKASNSALNWFNVELEAKRDEMRLKENELSMLK